jgi:multiple sugar transport system substrate-binding protein
VAKTTKTSSAAIAAAAASARSLTGQVSFFSWGSVAAVAERKKFAADFEQEHPGATCTFSLSSGVYLDKLLTMAAGGDAPDVFFVSPTDVPAMTAKGLLQALDAYIARSHYDLSDFVPAALQQYRRSGKIYGIPRGFGMAVMAYNVDLFQKMGVAPLPTDWKDTSWTFNDFLAMTKRVTSGTGTSQVYGFLPHPGNNREWQTYVWSNGGEVFSADYKQCLLDQPPAVEALQFLQDLMVKYQVAPSVAQQKVPTGSTDLFIANRAGTTIIEATQFAELRNRAKFSLGYWRHTGRQGRQSTGRRRCGLGHVGALKRAGPGLATPVGVGWHKV